MKFLSNLNSLYSDNYINYHNILYKDYSDVIQLDNDPFIGIVDDVLSYEETEHYIQQFSNKVGENSDSTEIIINRGLCDNYDNLTRKQRKSYSIDIDDNIDKTVRERVSKLCRLPVENCEKTILGKYVAGQSLHNHLDAVNFLPDRNLFSFMLSGGQRILTAIAYLNDVEDGGETFFPSQNIKVKPKKGRLLIFHNVNTNANIPHPNSLHGSLPLLKGEKHIATFWFRISNIDWTMYHKILQLNFSERQKIYNAYCQNLEYCRQKIDFIN